MTFRQIPVLIWSPCRLWTRHLASISPSTNSFGNICSDAGMAPTSGSGVNKGTPHGASIQLWDLAALVTNTCIQVFWLDSGGVIHPLWIQLRSPGVAPTRSAHWITSPPSLSWLPIILGILRKALHGLASAPPFLTLIFCAPVPRVVHTPSHHRAFACAIPFAWWFSVVNRC